MIVSTFGGDMVSCAVASPPNKIMAPNRQPMSFFMDVTLLGHEVAYSDIDFVLR
jgi:hypothetical protein